MGKTAFLFAGQGSQYPGMGKELYENIGEVYDIFNAAEDIRPGTLDQMFNGSAEDLKKTSNTQPCLFLCDLAAAIALRDKGVAYDAVAGFSLVEVIAMAAAGTMTAVNAFKLVCTRGRLMQTASEAVQGKMIAVIKADKAELEEMCKAEGVYPVNYNCPGQIVVSGTHENMSGLQQKLSEKKIRFIELPVGGAFHTPYMKSASDGLRSELMSWPAEDIKQPDIPVYANKTACPYPGDTAEIINTLSAQISNSVRWEETLINMADAGIDTFIECGPGNTLSGFVKRTVKDAKILNVCDMGSLQKATEELKN